MYNYITKKELIIKSIKPIPKITQKLEKIREKKFYEKKLLRNQYRFWKKQQKAVDFKKRLYYIRILWKFVQDVKRNTKMRWFYTRNIVLSAF